MTNEIAAKTVRGWPVLFGGLIAFVPIIALFVYAVRNSQGMPHAPAGMVALGIVAVLLFVANVTLLAGLTIIQPNTARVVIFFGSYHGTVKTSGFWWINSLAKKPSVSLRTNNMVTPTIKVNDVRGNPIEIAAVVVWRVENAARATFDVANFSSFVDTQCESALRHLASVYPYDTGDAHEMSLRGSTDEVSKTLMAELQERVAKAGVTIEETRLSHLAYASEIAGAMLRRQQADAIVSARFRIVEGAVGMVESALEHLEKGGKVKLDDERRAAMVSNLMVVLCGDHGVQPVVNAGTLYSG
ncbi:MAG: SPFH domain-containing protein [Phycisphaeraceae bacterium]|nr:SPFH domain-containing protein [Phycisphaeraceae bacterium]